MNLLSILIEKLSALEQRAVAAASLDYPSLGVSRIVFCLFYFLFLHQSYGWLAEVPTAFFAPPPLSIANLFDGFPGATSLLLLDGVIWVSATCVLLGFKTRAATATWLLAEVFGLSFKYSFGKIDHGILFQAAVFVMIWVDWGRCISIDQWLRDRRSATAIDEPPRCSLHVLSLLLAFGFLTAGYPKLVGWIDFDPDTGGFLRWLYARHYSQGYSHLLAGHAVAVRPLWIWELVDYGAVVFELAIILARFHGLAFRAWLVIAAVFHLINALVLNIPFLAHIPFYLCFVNWNRCFSVVIRFLERHPGAVCVALSVGHVIVSVIGRPAWGQILGMSGYLLLSCCLWGIVLAILSYELFCFVRTRSRPG